MTDSLTSKERNELERLRAALREIVDKGQLWAVHHKLEQLSQEMYDIAEEALK